MAIDNVNWRSNNMLTNIERNFPPNVESKTAQKKL